MENEKEVKASQELENAVTAEQEAIAEQVVEQVNQEVTEQVTEEVATENKPLTPEEVEKMVENATTKSLNSFKGSFANWTASQQKELKTQIDEVLDPLRKPDFKKCRQKNRRLITNLGWKTSRSLKKNL